MNWERPVVKVKVKRYPEGVYVDQCCAETVKKVDALPQTQTTWCCCMHGTYPYGGVEFISQLGEGELKSLLEVDVLDRCSWYDKSEYKGYAVRVVCHCPEDVKQRALEHFRD